MNTLQERTEQLRSERDEVRKMGGTDAVRKQHESGKLTARERVDLLFDPSTFVEFGILATHHSPLPT